MRIAVAAAFVLAAAGGDPPEDLGARWDAPPAVTLSVKDERADRVLGAISKLAGCRPFLLPLGGAKITLDLKGVPYFAAVDALAAAGGWSLAGTDFADEEAKGGFQPADPLRVIPAEKDLPAVEPCYAGPLRISLLGILAERAAAAVRFSPEAPVADPIGARLKVDLKILALDGLQEAELLSLSIEKAVDEAGRSLPTLEGGEGMSRDGLAGTRTVVLDDAGGHGARLAELSGRVAAVVPRLEETVELDLAKLPASARLGGATLTVLAVSDSGMKVEMRGRVLAGAPESRHGGFDLDVLKEGDPPGHGFFHRGMGTARLLLYDAAGKPVGSSGSAGSGDGERMTWDLDLEGRPAKAVLRAVTKAEPREVPFRFVDVPLPK